jgi:hypothetical protein
VIFDVRIEGGGIQDVHETDDGPADEAATGE